MAKRQAPDGNQEALFLVGSDQQIVYPQSEHESVDIARRAIYLLRAMDNLAQANIRDAFAGNEQAREKYGAHADAAAEGAVKNAADFRKAARFDFARGTGYLALIDAASAEDKPSVKQEAKKSFDNFQKGVGDESGGRKPLKDIRETLQRVLIRDTTDQNRQKGKRPHKVGQKLKPQTPRARAEESQLATRERLVAIVEDPRAGFITPTHQEKNMVMTYLDYLDNPEFELGPQNQLIEVINFHLKKQEADREAGIRYGYESSRSIAYVFGDFYEQATEQLGQLEEVAGLLHEVDNPNLSLAVALHADIEKAIPLIRFMDLKEYRTKGRVSYTVKGKEVSPKFSVMRSHRNEELADDQRNKVMQDPYTGERIGEVTKWLKLRAEQIKVGEVRGTIGQAIIDQQKRQMFHEIILKDFAEAKTAMAQLAEARRVAQSVLGIAA